MLNNKRIKITLWVILVIYGHLIKADISMVVQFYEKLYQHGELFNQTVVQINQTILNNDNSEYWYIVAKSYPKNSIDYHYAVEKYINEELASLIKTSEYLVYLQGLNSQLQQSAQYYSKQLNIKLKNDNDINSSITYLVKLTEFQKIKLANLHAGFKQDYVQLKNLSQILNPKFNSATSLGI